MRYRLLFPLLVALACMFGAQAQAREPALPKDPDKFTDVMAARFSDAIPGAKVTAKAPLRLEVVIANGAHTVYLDNIWSLCERDRRQCRKNIGDFLINMSGTMKEDSIAVKAADIRLVVRTADYVDQARKMAAGRPDRAVLTRPVAGDLWMICVGDSPHGIRVLQHAELAKLGLTDEQAIALGLKNTAAALPPLEADTHVLKQMGLKFATGDFYESSRMLLHEQWAAMSKTMGGHLVVAVPNNDFLIYGNGGGNGDRMVLSTFAKTVMEKAPKPMSASLFQWTPTGWEVVTP
jgi:uncharacterized protein YtpQ (UPF0354 family)